MSVYRILSMDGGNALNVAILLNMINTSLGSGGDPQPFINNVDLFAGTSSGAVNALFLAFHDDPTSALAGITDFWKNVYGDVVSAESLSRVLLSVAGVEALGTSSKLRDYLIGYFGAQTTLGDLKHNVLVVSFQLDNQAPKDRRWKPKIYHNFGGHDEPDRAELVVDVALRTTALPILLPIYQGLAGTGPGFVDGGVVANNPAMCALAEVLHQLQRGLQERTSFSETLLLSLGTGRNVIGSETYVDPPMQNGVADWGYRQWLLDIARPLLLLDIFLEGGMDAVDYQCRHLLRERFHRLNPLQKNMLIPNDEETQKQVQAAVGWINASGWLGAS